MQGFLEDLKCFTERDHLLILVQTIPRLSKYALDNIRIKR